MAGLCEDGNGPPGSLKAISNTYAYAKTKSQSPRNTFNSRQNKILRFNENEEEREIRLRTNNAIISAARLRRLSSKAMIDLMIIEFEITKAPGRGNSGERSQRISGQQLY
ncbi:hypothetical protein ANN_12931 [Periplaneta americana]|uniref:Uncharacterized protein n=1 Tax=Periplaneta americana TaxID=6978 RepID=A0ABQ8TKI2_PERAM|nr:hypothetical protein ANN_12931 [Periplaneta americana]